VQLLVERGAEINPVDANEYTPMRYAHERAQKSTRHQKIVDYLKEKGGELTWRRGIEVQ
jgi:hypothetical protein